MSERVFERFFPSIVEAENRAIDELDLALCEIGDVGPTARGRIAAAAAELLDNVRRHAYAADGPVEINALLFADRVRLRVADQGRGIHPIDAAPGLAARTSTGFGRLAALSEAVSFEPSSAGTAVAVDFELLPERFEEEADEAAADSPDLTAALGRLLSARAGFPDGLWKGGERG
ncbi:MAG: ATP-binding protein [Planctomycetota bacterium]